MTPHPDVSVSFGRTAAAVGYEDLAPAAVEAARKSILDTVGVSLAASGLEPAVAGVLDLTVSDGGAAEATLLGRAGRYPAQAAAFGNGALAHCLDFDDQTPWGQHCASSIVPAALAVAERVGGVSGRELLTAVAVGQDLFARLRPNVGWRKDWNLSTVLGVYAATAAAGRVLRLPGDRIVDALGIASMQSSGIMEMVHGTGSDLRGLYAGFSARGAVTAALLSAAGISGVARLFEGEHGVFANHFGGVYDRAAMLDGLGVEFRGAGTLYKAWPSVGTSHSHLQATIDLLDEHGVETDAVAGIEVFVGDYHDLMCHPLDERRAPRTAADAKFSLPYLVAVAAVRRTVSVTDFSPAALADPEVARVAERIVPVADPALDWDTALPPGRVRITTRDGRVLEAVGDRIPGSAERPLDWQAIERKFAACAAVAAVPPAPEAVRRVQRDVRHLESVPDVRDLLRPLTPPLP